MLLLFGAGICLSGCMEPLVLVPDSPFPIAEDRLAIDVVETGFTIPYGVAIVGEEEYFITDRIGKLYHWKENSLSEVQGLPVVVTFGVPGLPSILHGGLMDVSIHPNYASNGWIYICYLAEDGFAKVSRLTLQNDSIDQFETIFVTKDPNYTGNGMRIAWQDESRFFLNIGNSDYSTREYPILVAQDLGHDAGKIHRIGEDGSVPPDNPLFDGSTVPTSIWSYGHRDVQGLYYERSTSTLFGLEHGPKGGDEFNVIEKGANYGWPLFSYGVNYDGAQVSTLSEDSASRFTVLPVHTWTVPTPSGGQALAPSCLLKVSESSISDWNDHFIFGSLAFRRLMKYNPETQETVALNVTGRVRTIKQLPGGDLLALVERNDLRRANGKIIKIRQLPKKEPDDM